MNNNVIHIINNEPQLKVSMPEAGQYDSADQDMEEDDLAGELDFDSEEYDMMTWRGTVPCVEREPALSKAFGGADPLIEEEGTLSSLCSGEMTGMIASPTGTGEWR